MVIIYYANFSKVALGKPFKKTNYGKERVKFFLRPAAWNSNSVDNVVKILNLVNLFNNINKYLIIYVSLSFINCTISLQDPYSASSGGVL